MSGEVWFVYLGTVLVFMCTPGPSHLLMLSNSLGNGFKKSTATAAGDLTANLLQMAAAAAGLATVLQSSQHMFVYIKWAGVCYLAYLGLKLLIAKESEFDAGPKRSFKSLYWQGFITSAANPKAVIFFAALFPQFISTAQPLFGQFLILSLTYLTIDGLFLCFYGKSADFLGARFKASIGRYLNKISGGLFIGAAIMLGLKNVESD